MYFSFPVAAALTCSLGQYISIFLMATGNLYTYSRPGRQIDISVQYECNRNGLYIHADMKPDTLPLPFDSLQLVHDAIYIIESDDDLPRQKHLLYRTTSAAGENWTHGAWLYTYHGQVKIDVLDKRIVTRHVSRQCNFNGDKMIKEWWISEQYGIVRFRSKIGKAEIDYMLIKISRK